jgi:NADPH:quinone reductase
MRITDSEGAHGIVDSTGGPVVGELIRSTALGAQVIIYGGMSPDNFVLHNFDILLKVIAIKSYVYRYFFNSPQQRDTDFLLEIARLSSQFKVPVAGMHPLEDFNVAVEGTIRQPEQGKHFFYFPAHT